MLVKVKIQILHFTTRGLLHLSLTAALCGEPPPFQVVGQGFMSQTGWNLPDQDSPELLL